MNPKNCTHATNGECPSCCEFIDCDCEPDEMTEFEREMQKMEDLSLKCLEAAEGLRKQIRRIMGVEDVPVVFNDPCPRQDIREGC